VKSADVPLWEPSIDGNDRARRARSEAGSSASPNRRLSEHDAWWCITQRRAAREYSRERDDLRNVIEDRRRLRHRSPSPPRWSLAEDVATYEHPSTVETLKTISQKYDESLWDYVKYLCKVRNAIPYIQDIEIINAFRDGVSDIKTVEEITMKKLKMVADLLAIADVCIEASEARV
jgi:hypothetical protein